jgi:hypothetical protein
MQSIQFKKTLLALAALASFSAGAQATPLPESFKGDGPYQVTEIAHNIILKYVSAFNPNIRVGQNTVFVAKNVGGRWYAIAEALIIWPNGMRSVDDFIYDQDIGWMYCLRSDLYAQFLAGDTSLIQSPR